MSVRELLDRYGIAPNKALGQNFLVAPGVLAKIVGAAEIAPGDRILEVGPGLGVLTQALADSGAVVVAVELDSGLLPLLGDKLGALPNVTIVPGDILEIDPASVVAAHAGDGPYAVVANLPYQITSAALRHLLESEPPPTRLVVMVQREVAQRIVATPREMSLLALSVQFYGHPQIVARVPAGAFFPRPKVDSAILRIRVREDPLLSSEEAEQLFSVARAGFSQRRKQLKNAMSAGLAVDGDRVAMVLETAKIDPSRRAQTLSLEEWLTVRVAFAEAGLV